MVAPVSRPIPVLLVVDEDAAGRDDLRAALEGGARFRVRGEVTDARKAPAATARLRPALCVLAHSGDSASAAREILARARWPKIAVLAGRPHEEELLRVIRAGASGYISRDIEPERLTHVLGRILAGEAAIPRSLVASIVSELHRRRTGGEGRPTGPAVADEHGDVSLHRARAAGAALAVRPLRLPRASRGPSPARLLLADDHPLIRLVVRERLEESGYVVCAEAGDGPGAVAAALRERPDLCILNINMPGDGIAAAGELSARLPETRILMLTGSTDEEDFLAALRAGACGLLHKGVDPAGIPRAIAAALAGEAVVPRGFVSALTRAVA
jgi:DNA-binding NarL/FixJ family response regulator